MKVDVLMPIYKTPLEHVKQAIDSLWAQTWPEFKLIIVDDNNPKGELLDYLYGEIASRTCCVSIVRRHENNGIAAALDDGLKFCNGDLILRMDSDDIARPEWISRQVAFFVSHPYAVICGVQIQLFNQQGKTRQSNHPYRVTFGYARNNDSYWLCNHPGIAYKREVVLQLGGYGNIPAKFAEDYALWIKFLKAGHTIYNLPDVLIDYRIPQVNQETFQGNRPEELRQSRHSDEWLEFLKQQKNKLYE
jgi:glycosyltransferase involved in cell wall biosynthesis